ncbi:DUF2140 family protein [Streptococcus didelphis]|nr:DUF2140 family protein [Streptococcus didelphis]WMB30165.1 DUF2140 family protein [Streptococcus didelphis]
MESIKKYEKNNNVNWWKWAFLFIFALNIAFLGVIASRLIQVREPASEKLLTKKQNHIKVGSFTTNRQQLNKTVASYLSDYQTTQLTYKLYTTSSSIIFESKYQLLGYEVPLYIYFQPIALTNGDLQLQITSLSAGTLPLPESEVLQYVKSSYKLPDFIEVNIKKSSLIIHLQKMDNNAGLYLKAKKLDLLNDQISFDIYKK